MDRILKFIQVRLKNEKNNEIGIGIVEYCDNHNVDHVLFDF